MVIGMGWGRRVGVAIKGELEGSGGGGDGTVGVLIVGLATQI